MSDQFYNNEMKNGKGEEPHEDNFRRRYVGEIHPGDDINADELDLKHILGTLLRYKWTVIIITLIVTVLAGVYAYLQLPVYQSEGTILISDDRNRYSYSGSDLSNLLTTTYGIGAGSRLTNEIQVFQSRRLADALADKILEQGVMENGERFPILWKSYPEDNTIAARDTVAQKIRNTLQVHRVDREADILKISFSSFSPLEAAWLVNTTIDTYLELSAEQSRVAAGSALVFLEREQEEVKERLNRAEEALRDYMNTTSLVQIDGQTSAVITRLADIESQRQQLQVRSVAVQSSIESYEKQLDEIRPGLADQFAENIGPTMERAQFRLAEMETERDLLLQRNPQLRANPETEPYLVELDDRILRLKRDINQMAANLINDDSDVFIGFLNRGESGITERIIDLRSKLIELRIEESQLLAQEEVLNRRLAEENEFFDGLPANMLELARLRRDVEVNEQIYLAISNQYAETGLWEQTQFGAGRLLDSGYVPEKPSAPRKKMYVIVGFLMGGIISMVFAFTRESLNRTIDGTTKVRQTGFPLLAIIPDMNKSIQAKFKGAAEVEVQGKTISTSWSTLVDTVSPIAESYRRLHNNIIYSNPDEKFKTIVITSSSKGEGKSTISINLAVALAEAGKKVLLIDTDLRRPAIHKFTGEKREPGIVEILYDAEPASMVIKPSIADGVHVITAGRNIPNASAFMKSERLQKFIIAVADRYDHIVIDTPPYGIITDAALLMRLADGVVLVTKFGQTQINELNHTIENLKRIRANIVGTVITNYKHKQSADYYYADQYTYDSNEAYEAYQEEA